MLNVAKYDCHSVRRQKGASLNGLKKQLQGKEGYVGERMRSKTYVGWKHVRRIRRDNLYVRTLVHCGRMSYIILVTICTIWIVYICM